MALSPQTSLKTLAIAALKSALPAIGTTAPGSARRAAAVARAHLAARHRTDLYAFATSSDRLAAITDDPPAPPQDVTDFVQALRHLNGVPYQHLVGDERLLPTESLRFFYLDQAWVDCLVDGALSLGRSTTGDLIRDQVNSATHGIATSAPGQVVTGFLLRSRAVKHWPGLEVSAFRLPTPAEQEQGLQWAPLSMLRLDRLGPETMLGLFDGEVALCRFHEPPEGMHFGVDIPEDTSGVDPATFIKNLRKPDDGTAFLPAVTVAKLPYRAGASLVLGMASLADAVKTTITPKPDPFTAAEFGLEMIEGVDQVTFVNSSARQGE